MRLIASPGRFSLQRTRRDLVITWRETFGATHWSLKQWQFRAQQWGGKGAAWADSCNAIPMDGFLQDGKYSPSPWPSNCTNNSERYSFHSGGVHCVLADGAVRFLSQTIDIDTKA